ncbi:MAG: OmpH family outer membrane protein [bacterium]|nr:OmpH family outer membrane protein [bacterium]
MFVSSRLKFVSSAFVLAFIVMGSVAGMAPVAEAADDKPLGVIDSRRIIEEYEAAKDAQAQYQKFLQELELQVADKEKELTNLMEEIESQKLLLGEEALRAKYQVFETKKAEYFQFQESIEQQAEAEFNSKITPITDQVKTIVERIGKEKGFGLIIDTATLNVMYLDSDKDLTNDVLAALAKGEDN